MEFIETQRFRQPWLWALLIVAMGASCVPLWIGGYQQLVLHRTWGNRPVSDGALVGMMAATTAVTLGLLWLMWAAELSVAVRADGLHVRYFPFTRQRRIAYGEIRRAWARTYNPIGEYGGWGVRGFGNNRALNASGNRGVQLELASGQRLLIGSQRADDLAAAINAHMPNPVR